MDPSTNALLAMLLAAALGARHGFDADHLATIDGLTRFNSGRRIGPWCGCLFTLGHGAVVTAVAVWSSGLAERWTVPVWMEHVGVWIAILSLTVLGLLNLRAVMVCKDDEVVQLVGLKGRLLERLGIIRNPWLIVLAGAMFALSFDTLALAAMFSFATTGGLGRPEMAFGLGLSFTLGMLVSDGINGFWISRLLGRADRMARVASRLMGSVVGAMSLLVAAWALGRYLSPVLAAWGDGKELVGGCVVIAIIAASFLAAVHAARTGVARSVT